MLCLKAVVVFVEMSRYSCIYNLKQVKVPVYVVDAWFMFVDIKDLVIF